jgi:hypothetical protein
MRLPLRTGPDASEPQYVFARHSRRAGGLVLALDLAPNRRCNWACDYCDVPGLEHGEGPALDLPRLGAELERALERVTEPEFGPGRVAEAAGLAAVLIEGQGEPTHCFDFEGAVGTLAEVLTRRGLAGRLRPVLLTNGERLSERKVREGLATLGKLQGTVWFKLDSATREGLQGINHTDLILRHVRNNLRVAAETLPTWLQTCVFERGGKPSLDEAERQALVGMVRSQLAAKVALRGVQLYSPHRPIADARGAGITAPKGGWVEGLAAELRAVPIEVQVCL